MNSVVNELASAVNGAEVFAFSTGKQYSLENAAWGNGAFTKALVEGLGGKLISRFLSRVELEIASQVWTAGLAYVCASMSRHTRLMWIRIVLICSLFAASTTFVLGVNPTYGQQDVKELKLSNQKRSQLFEQAVKLYQAGKYAEVIPLMKV